LVKGEDRMHCVRISDIEWCEADGNYVQLFLGSRGLRIRRTLAQMGALLCPLHFIRISRATIVNIDRILEVQPTQGGDYLVVMQGGCAPRLTRGFRREFMEQFFVL
jgi:two-component system LytT family response regulator